MSKNLKNYIYLPVSKIFIRKFRYPLREYEESSEFLGYDTETYLGACKLLCNSNLHNNYIYNPSFLECLDFLFENPERKVHRIFWNMDFDLSAMFKLWNDIDKIKDLLDGLEVEFEGYTLTYLRPKFFQIKSKKHSIIYTDFYYLYKMSLNKASKDYLNDKKIDIIDGNKLNTDLEYWIKNRDSIIEYCIKDCILTAQLGKYLIDKTKEANLPIPRFITSHASFSKQYFRSNCKIPSIKWIPVNILDIACQCYYGGRFEVLTRGYFPKAYNFDIKSAYPATIRELPSLKYGRWKKILKPNKKENIGYYKVLLNIPKMRVSPFIIKYKGILVNPSGIFETWITWYEYDLLKDYVVKFYYGYQYFPSKREYYPFREMIDHLYKNKEKYKSIDEVISWIFKIFMNAFYGCFWERHKDPISKLTFAGTLFNPIYASIICAKTRWQLLKDVKKRHWKHILAFHTDSIITKKKIRELKISKKIGKWELEVSGKTLILMSGIYQIKDKVKNRGFSTRKQLTVKSSEKGEKMDWFDILKKHSNSDKIPFKKIVVMKIGNSVRRFDSMEKVNTFTEENKEMNINSDKKRDWERPFNDCNDVLTSQINSEAIVLKYIREDGLY